MVSFLCGAKLRVLHYIDETVVNELKLRGIFRFTRPCEAQQCHEKA